MPLNGSRKLPTYTQEACRDILNAEVPDPERPKKQAVLAEFNVKNIENLVLNIGNQEYRLHVREFISNVEGDNIHTCLRIGGNDETLDGGNLKVYPLLSSFVEALEREQTTPGFRPPFILSMESWN